MNRKQVISLFIKLVISSLTIAYVLYKVPVDQIRTVLATVDFAWLGMAFVFFVLSKLFSVTRLQHLLKEAGVPVDWVLNSKLYWLGMFYNQFLPGGVGGDVYKTVWLSRQYVRGKVEMAKLILWDRISGMVALLALLCVLAGTLFSFWTVALGCLVAACIYLVYLPLVYKKQLSLGLCTQVEGYSFLVQLSQLLSAYFLLSALHIQDRQLSYLVVFLASSVASVLPLSLGGVGIRELTFMLSADYLALDAGRSIGIGLLFYLVSLVASLGGIVYLFMPLVTRKDEFHTLTKPIP